MSLLKENASRVLTARAEGIVAAVVALHDAGLLRDLDPLDADREAATTRTERIGRMLEWFGLMHFEIEEWLDYFKVTEDRDGPVPQ